LSVRWSSKGSLATGFFTGRPPKIIDKDSKLKDFLFFPPRPELLF